MTPELRILPASGNWRPGRAGGVVDVIVVHIMEGTLSGTDQWFRNPASGVSAHYGVGRDGRVVQWVQDGDTAFHAGKKVRPSAAIVLERATENPNNYSIGIECEGRAGDEPPSDLLAALADLVATVADRHRIPVDRRHVVGHREIRADKGCPGRIDVDAVVRLARGGGVEVAPAPRVGERRWSEHLGEHVVLTRYESDTRWWYVRESLVSRFGAQATTPWSQMPPERPR